MSEAEPMTYTVPIEVADHVIALASEGQHDAV